MNYDKDEIRRNITDEQMMELLADMGGEPIMQPKAIVSKTICHCGESHKLYYFFNTHLFRCFTDCGDDAFDIFELVRKVKSNSKEEYSLNKAIEDVAKYFNFNAIEEENGFFNELRDSQKIFNKYIQTDELKLKEKKVELNFYDPDILKNYPQQHILDWEEEGISYEICKRNNIKYNPVSEGILIPHYDINNNLIGIRERTLIKENEIYGKYKPAILNQKMYNHPLSFALYNLNNSKDNIKKYKRAVVAEGEKSCLLYASYFGSENDISVACCGSALIKYQVDLLLSLGVEEIIVCFDKQFKEIGDEEWKKWVAKLTKINEKYSSYVTVSFVFDKWNYLGYKDSPLDRGKDTFIKLFQERIIL